MPRTATTAIDLRNALDSSGRNIACKPKSNEFFTVRSLLLNPLFSHQSSPNAAGASFVARFLSAPNDTKSIVLIHAFAHIIHLPEA